MKSKLFRILTVVSMIVTLILSALPVHVFADTNQDIPNIVEKLDHGWFRYSPNLIGHVISNDDKNQTVEFVVSSLPLTLEDNKTLIDNKWYLKSDPSGQRWFENGNNVFKVRVADKKTSVLDKQGRLTTFNSILSIQNSYGEGTPTITDDPLNGQKDTALSWFYGDIGNGSTLTRYLRSNNGRVSELWKLTGPPTSSIIFRPNMTQESKFNAKTTPMLAFDSGYHLIPNSSNPIRGFYTISPESLSNVKYPVYIDPTYDFSSLSDAWIEKSDNVYATSYGSATGTVIDGDFPAWVGQELFAGVYEVSRSFVMFDTSSIPVSLSISATALYLFGYLDESDTNFNIFMCSGQPTYPHNPAIAGDFAFANYQTDPGSGFATSYGWSTATYNLLTLSNVGWIQKGGTTKLALRSSQDISNIAPTGNAAVSFWQKEHGSSYAPLLRVVGTIPVVVPIVITNSATSISTTGATLNGYLSNDGGATTSVRFAYGPTVAYGSTTPWIGGFSSSQSFNALVAGLVQGTVYHFRAEATNTAGTSNGADISFTALPSAPTYFAATAGNAQAVLTWAKGIGADKTVIIMKTGSYPTTLNDGTNIYSNTGTNYTKSGLTNGVTYYFAGYSLAADGITYSTTYAQAYATPIALSAPGVSTGVASAVTGTTATLQGSLTSLGGYASADVSFNYGLTNAYGSNTTPVTLTALSVFTDDITGLTPATPYHFRAKATGTGGTTYGIDAVFTTGAPSAPTMTTGAATGIQINGAQLNGVVTLDGSAPPVTVWFQYGITTQYELGLTPTAAGLATGGTFYYGLSNLLPNTLYHYRAVGQNSVGITYGTDTTFTTLTPVAPTTTSNSATNIGAAQATLQGTLVTDGSVTCQLSFEWGTTTSYGNTTTATPVSGGAGTGFNALISGLVTDTTYHFRAVATNLGGTGVGLDETFITVFAPPSNLLATAISSTTINLMWTLRGDQSYIVYKTTGYPVDRNDGTLVYFGSETYASLTALVPGTTYYFSAWSWKTGDIWTTTNTNAIATTPASSGAGIISTPVTPTGSSPITPASWFDVPTNAIIRNFPLYEIFTGWAIAFQMPEGTFWALVAMCLSTILGALAFVTWRQAIPAVGIALVVIVVCAVVEMCPTILAIFIGMIEIGAGYGLSSLGGNVSGRSI